MCLDINARRNLELTEKLRDKSKKRYIIMGVGQNLYINGRKKVKKMDKCYPLLDIEKINKKTKFSKKN